MHGVVSRTRPSYYITRVWQHVRILMFLRCARPAGNVTRDPDLACAKATSCAIFMGAAILYQRHVEKTSDLIR